MPVLTKLDDHKCGVCGHDEFLPVDFTSYTMPSQSSHPDINDFVNHICDNCGVVTPYPQPDPKRLAKHYNSAYRKDKYALDLGGEYVHPPVQIPWSGVSFLRFQSFYDMVQRHKAQFAELGPKKEDHFVDYGAYQGMFLYGAKNAWGCQGVAYDYNEKGIAFARDALGMTHSVVAKDIYSDTFAEKAKYVSLIHVFEHLQHPDQFLSHLKKDVITSDGWLYIEVPNVFGFPMSDPTHYFSYTENSLRRVMELNGFEVIETWIGNYPMLEEYEEWSTPIQNIYCVARPSDTVSAADYSRVHAQPIYDEIRSSYRTLSTNYVGRRFKNWVRECLRMGKHCVQLISFDYLRKMR